MSQVENSIRSQIQSLYESNPHIHMNVSLSRPKLVLKNVDATITGVYPHIFQIEENSTNVNRTHSLQYSDIITRQIGILELNLDGLLPKPKR